MTDHAVDTTVVETKAPRGLDLTLTITVWLLAIALLSLMGVFAYTVYATRQEAALSSPTQRAMKGLEDLVKKNPNSAPARVRLGEAYAAVGMNDAAVQSLKAAIKIDPKHSGAYFDLGMVSMAMTEPKAAASYFQKVLELTAGGDSGVQDRREQCYFYLGQIAVGDKRWDDAVGFLKSALRIHSDSADSYYFLAIAYEGLNDKDKAVKSLLTGLAFDPTYPAAHYELGRIYASQGHEASAAIEFRTALDHNPAGTQAADELKKFGAADPHITRAEAALAAGKLAEAETQGLEASAIDPSNVRAELVLARTFEREGDKTNALARYKRLKELDPQNAVADQGIQRLSGK